MDTARPNVPSGTGGGTGYWACPVKCDACRACPARKNDCVGVKFEVRKHFIREGAYFTGVLDTGYWLRVASYGIRVVECVENCATSLPDK